MKAWLKILLPTAACIAATLCLHAQQQPVLTVEIEQINVGGVADGTVLPPVPFGTVFIGGTTFGNPVNEANGPMLTTINISAFATGTHLVSSFTYSFFVNGIPIGTTSGVVQPPDRAVVQWTPPQPGSYFLTVKATDGSNTATSLPVRFFATGTVVNSPLDGTLVPAGSSIVLKADATVASGFIREIQFFENGVKIGSPDKTYPYSLIYTPGVAGSPHSITAQATDNNGNLLTVSAPVRLTTVTAITPLPNCAISNPVDHATILVPATADNIPVQVNASSPTGFITKVELYIDGVLFGTATAFPYTFSWHPAIIGNYTITALAYDDKNNVIASPTNLVLIAAPLTVSLTSPSQGGTVTGGSPTQLRAVATDTNTDEFGTPLKVESVQFFVDGAFVGQATTPSSTNTFTVTATLTQKLDADGNPKPSTITALATDSKNLTGLSPGVTVSVTSGGSGGGVVIIGNPPTAAVTWPVTGTEAAVNRPVFIAGSATDTDGNIVSVQFFANNTSIGAATVYPYYATWTPTSLGTYTLTMKATDSDGNTVTSAGVKLSVVDPSPTPPVVTIASPVNGSTVQIGSAQKLRAEASDLLSSIASVQFYVDGLPFGLLDSAYPYETTWTPANPGIYTLTARAANASGNQSTSTPVLIVASTDSSDAVYSGTYQGSTEAGSFSVVAATGKTATFLGYSTTPDAPKSYFYGSVPVDASGGFTLIEPSGGKPLVSGAAGDTGVSGTFDHERLTFIGVDTKYFRTGTTLPTGYYTGKLSSRASSSLAAILGFDGSIMIYAVDGSFNDAGGGKLDSTGAFNFASIQGNRFTGKADPVTRLLTGTLSGTSGGGFTAASVRLGVTAADKVTGLATEIGSNIYAQANGNTYDQILLRGPSATVTADPGQITRTSFLDLSGDIIQVEFSGAGRLSISLDNPSGPVPATNYNQPGVAYMKGHANLVITDADETTNVSVFSVGQVTAVNQALFKSGVAYDGIADIGYLAILSANGKFGGVRTANAVYVAASGMAGICAPGVQFMGPVYVGDINASDTANPMLLLGSAADVKITGGDLWQANSRSVQVSGITQLKFVDGTTSQGALMPAQIDRSRLEQNGRDVTMQLVVNPTP